MVKPSRLLPGSIPTATGCVSLADGSTFRWTQKMPRFQNGVAFLSLIHRRARLGIVGMSGCWLMSMTGTYTISLLAECLQTFDADQPRGEGVGWRLSHRSDCHVQQVQLACLVNVLPSSLTRLATTPTQAPSFRMGLLTGFLF